MPACASAEVRIAWSRSLGCNQVLQAKQVSLGLLSLAWQPLCPGDLQH